MNETLSLFGDALKEIADGPKMTGHASLTGALMKRMAEKGATLEQLADQRMMDRKRGTLEGYARRFGVSFPDYVPMGLRRKVRLVQMGDFYEAIGDDAEPVAKALGIVLTSRNGQPMCGVPAHAAEAYKEALKTAWLRPTFVKSKATKHAA